MLRLGNEGIQQKHYRHGQFMHISGVATLFWSLPATSGVMSNASYLLRGTTLPQATGQVSPAPRVLALVCRTRNSSMLTNRLQEGYLPHQEFELCCRGTLSNASSVMLVPDLS